MIQINRSLVFKGNVIDAAYLYRDINGINLLDNLILTHRVSIFISHQSIRCFIRNRSSISVSLWCPCLMHIFVFSTRLFTGPSRNLHVPFNLNAFHCPRLAY